MGFLRQGAVRAGRFCCTRRRSNSQKENRHAPSQRSRRLRKGQGKRQGPRRQARTEGFEAAFQAPQVLPLHRREDRVDRLQGRRSAEGLHRRERQDHPGTDHRNAHPLPSPALGGGQARALSRADAVHRPALKVTAIQVILLEKVVNLGGLGDVVKVKDGYARNYLLPQGKAKRATPESLAEFEKKRTELEIGRASCRERV